MSKPAARMGDMHMCPMVTPGVPPIPHVGGPITMGMPTVLIGNMPAATMGSMCTCVGPPDTIILGSMGVLIGGKPAARMGDMCAHGGMIAMGLPTVLIGEMGPGGPGGPVTPGMLGAIGKGIAAVIEHLQGGLDQLAQQNPSSGSGIGPGITQGLLGGLGKAMSGVIQGMVAGLVPDQPGLLGKVARVMDMTNAMNQAAEAGTGFVENCGK